MTTVGDRSSELDRAAAPARFGKKVEWEVLRAAYRAPNKRDRQLPKVAWFAKSDDVHMVRQVEADLLVHTLRDAQRALPWYEAVLDSGVGDLEIHAQQAILALRRTDTP